MIVTHPGGAHKDDLLAVSCLVATFGCPVERREPTAEDLADGQIAVVDVGGRHEREQLNFDHHQFPREEEPLCALSLVLQYLGVYEDALQFCDWLKTLEWMDCRGPLETGKFLGLSRETLAKLNSPIDIFLIRQFGEIERVAPGDSYWEFLRNLGADLLQYIRGLRERIRILEERCELWELPVPGGGTAVFLEKTDGEEGTSTMGIGFLVQSKGLTEQCLAVITPDSRGEGYALKRFNDHPRVNFSRIADEEDVRFAHAGGFVAKTDAVDPVRLRELLLQAIE
ncbi:MAG: MYG1 family protein [Puniceicoccaceae bacterium]